MKLWLWMAFCFGTSFITAGLCGQWCFDVHADSIMSFAVFHVVFWTLAVLFYWATCFIIPKNS